MNYRFYNNNPFNRKTSDCSIRAIALATGRKWDDVYKEISDNARKKGYMMNSVSYLEDYLDDRYPRTCHYSKTINEFVNEFPKGKYVVSMPNHLTTVIDGINYDTFPTLNRKMWCAWKIE